MGWFDNQIRERQASDERLMDAAAETLSDALGGRRVAGAGGARSLPDRALSAGDLYRFLFASLTRRDWVTIVGGALLVSVVGMVLPAATSYVFSEVVPAGAEALGVLGPLLAMLTASAVAQALVSALRAQALGGAIEKASEELTSALMERALRFPVSFFGEHTAGDMASRLLSMRSMVQLLGDAVFSVGLTALFSLVYVLQMVVMWPQLAGIGFVVVAAQIAACALVAYRRARMIGERLSWRARRSGSEVSLINGIQKIRLAGADKRAFARWAQLYGGEVRTTYAEYLDAALLGALSVVGLLSTYAFAAPSGITAAGFMGFSTAFGVVSAAIDRLGRAALAGLSPRPFMELIGCVLDAVPETAHRGQIVERLSGRIELDNVTFSYGGGRAPVLRGLSLKIRPGEYVGIVGRTGCGKSTLMRLLLGFEQPQSGAVYFDGRDVKQLDVRSLRRHMGVVLQDCKLFAGSLKENILVGAPQLGEEDAWRAAELAGIADDIRAMPMGMSTMIGEGASGLSGGQRQRVMIARAIAASPRVLLFDEATSALDNATQAHVSESLSSLRCTRVAIAHRLSTVRDCDRILVLDGGRIAEEGTYAELMAAGGLFAELVRRQQA